MNRCEVIGWALTAGMIVLMGTASAINIDCGRQLFVDDALIASTNGVVRHWNRPVKAERPVIDFGATDGGLWWDPTRGKYRLWYQQEWLGDIHYAESADGIRWTQPTLASVPGSNRVFAEAIPLDSWSVRPNYAAVKPYAHWCLHVSAPGGMTDDTLYESSDGLFFTKIGVAGQSGDRSSVYYDPFRREWVFALRDYREGVGRTNRRVVSPTFANAKWNWPDGAEKWLVATNRPNWQLYNFDAVPYESLMLGVMEVLYNTPKDNGDCSRVGLPKQTALHFCFSRDGRTFVPRDEADIAPSGWGSGKWDTGYLSPVGGICTVSEDELRFYYTGLRGDGTRLTADGKGFGWAKNGMYANAAIGCATLRRDGFAGLVADADGEIVTQPLEFAGGHLFVNADARFGAVSAEVQDGQGDVLKGFAAEDAVVRRRIDATKIELGWKTASLASLSGRTIRFRFRLQVATLYSFWVSKSAQGESRGFVAAGGPDYSGLLDGEGG